MAKEKDLVKGSGVESVTGTDGKKASKPKKAAAKKPTKRSTSQPDGKSGGKSRSSPSTQTRAKSVDPVDVAVQDIELRAYYIAERRNNMGWPGDETSDWIEAERQLREESQRKRKRSR